jgi:hypothetical protein
MPIYRSIWAGSFLTILGERTEEKTSEDAQFWTDVDQKSLNRIAIFT